MKIEITSGTPVHVQVSGSMSGDQGKELEAAVSPLLSDAGHEVRVDLSRLSRIDSQGLGVLVSLTCRSNMNKGSLVFTRPSMFVEEVLRVTQLDRFLKISSAES
jgi:anti-anti-sigma factor